MTLRAIRLAAARGDRLLFENLNFSLAPGEALHVQGANGVGKSSLLRLLAGLGEPVAGELLWQEQPLQAQREQWQRGLVYCGHQGGLKDELSAAENLLLAARVAGAAVCAEHAVRALRATGLREGFHLPVRSLSQGQRKRVSLARLFLPARPQVLVLDEPFDALDIEASEGLAYRLGQLVGEGAALAYTTHQAVTLPVPRQAALALASRDDAATSPPASSTSSPSSSSSSSSWDHWH